MTMQSARKRTEDYTAMGNMNRKDETPVVKMLKPGVGGGIAHGSISGSLRMSKKPQQKDLDANDLKEGAFRRLLTEKKLQTDYDNRLNQAQSLVKKAKYNLFEADKKLKMMDIDHESYKMIFEAVDYLDQLKTIVHQ